MEKSFTSTGFKFIFQRSLTTHCRTIYHILLLFCFLRCYILAFFLALSLEDFLIFDWDMSLSLPECMWTNFYHMPCFWLIVRLPLNLKISLLGYRLSWFRGPGRGLGAILGTAGQVGLYLPFIPRRDAQGGWGGTLCED